MAFTELVGQGASLFSSIKKYIPRAKIEKHIKRDDNINKIRRPNLSTIEIATPVPITWHNATKNAERPKVKDACIFFL